MLVCLLKLYPILFNEILWTELITVYDAILSVLHKISLNVLFICVIDSRQQAAGKRAGKQAGGSTGIMVKYLKAMF